MRNTPRGTMSPGITVTVYSAFTAAAFAARCPAPLGALGRVCEVPNGSRAGAPASRSIPASPAGGRWWGPLDPGRRRPVRRHGEKRRKIGCQRAQRRHRSELVIRTRWLRPRSRPSAWRNLVNCHRSPENFDQCAQSALSGRLCRRQLIIPLSVKVRRRGELSRIRKMAENREEFLCALVVVPRHTIENRIAKAKGILGQQAIRQILCERRSKKILQEPHLLHAHQTYSDGKRWLDSRVPQRRGVHARIVDNHALDIGKLKGVTPATTRQARNNSFHRPGTENI